MRIYIFRHGRPAHRGGGMLDAGGFARWVEDYNASGPDPSHPPTRKALDAAAMCKAVVTSPLPRARVSAGILFPGKSILVEPSLVEFRIPTPRVPLLVLPPDLWIALSRSLWMLGLACGAESRAEANDRAARGAEMLTRIASFNKSVAFVGHGMINAQLASELRKRGWRGPSIPGGSHWDVTEYTSALIPIGSPKNALPNPEAV